MGITVKEVLELLKERVNEKGWKDYDSGFEFNTIADFGALKKELEHSIVLGHFLEKYGIDMKFDTIGTHFIKI